MYWETVQYRNGLNCFNVYLFNVIVLIKLKFTLQTQSASSTLQKHKSSSSFTPFIDPRLLQISPSSGTTVTSVGKYSSNKKAADEQDSVTLCCSLLWLRHGMVAVAGVDLRYTSTHPACIALFAMSCIVDFIFPYSLPTIFFLCTKTWL